MKELNYWQHLQQLKLYSLERRRERFVIIHVWKIMNGLAPNLDTSSGGNIVTHQHIRFGLLCRKPPLNIRSPASMQTLKKNSFAERGPRLFNAMPKDIREFQGTVDDFKNRLDVHLRGIPDKPSLPQYFQPASSNSVVDQLYQVRLGNV